MEINHIPLSKINIEKLTDKDVEILKLTVREIEKKVKEKNKPKTITIPGDVHCKVKNLCNTLQVNIGDWVAKTLLAEIEKNDCVIKDKRSYEEIKNEEIEKLKEKYNNFFQVK